jgi:hypothetical protein
MRRLFDLQEERRSRRLKLVSGLAIACVLVVAALFVGTIRRGAGAPQATPTESAVLESVDLSDAGTLRGNQPAPLQAVSLPAALTKVTIILPRYSDLGQYVVAVTRDQKGSDLVAKASGTATGGPDRAEVSVYLDLRKSKPGSYFLSTTHEQDQASYYYPLQIK